MERFLKQYSPHLYAILRIFAGLMFAMHGSQKVFGIPGDESPVPLASLLGVGAALELICGVLIALGLVASYAAFIASGGMAVCYFTMHFPQGFLPILNQGELAVLYCFLFLYIAAQGSGVWSIDALLGEREKPAVLT